jgi:hypothetical protein
MRGPSEIRQKSSIIIKMTISKNVLPPTSPSPFRAISRRPVTDGFSFARPSYYLTNRPFGSTIMVTDRTACMPGRPGFNKMGVVYVCNEEDDMRERMAYLILIGMLIILVTFVLAVVGKGDYQPPPPEKQEQGSISFGGTHRGAPLGAFNGIEEGRAKP